MICLGWEGTGGKCRRGECCSVLDRALNFCQDHSQEVSEEGVPQGLMFGLVVGQRFIFSDL